MSEQNLLLSECGYPHLKKATVKESLTVQAQPSCEPDVLAVATVRGLASGLPKFGYEIRAIRALEDDEDLYAESDYEALRAEVKHWKSNHADVVGRLAIATQRPDLPVDRIPAIKELEALRAENDKLKHKLESTQDSLREHMAMLHELQAENERLKVREQWIHDNATTSGGVHGFTVAFFVPVDHEDIFCGISDAIKLEQK